MSFGKVALLVRSVAIGGCGGGIFLILGLPLPWVLGSMVATIAAAALGLKGHMPRSVRNAVIPAIGVTFGSAFDRELLAYLPDIWLLILMTVGYLAAIVGCGCVFFTRFGRMDLRTAYFASVPGSFSEMLFVAEEYRANISQIAIVHSMRQVVALSLITIGFRYWLEIDTSQLPPIGEGDLTWTDAAILLLCGVLGLYGAKVLRLPSAHLFGPMALSAAAYLGGIVSTAPPGWMVAFVQIFIGIFVGLRFEGVKFSAALPLMRLAAIWALLLLGFATLTAEIAVLFLGLPFEAAFLAFAPGGAIEISVVALTAGVSLSIVTAIQMVRISLTVLFVPIIFRMLPGNSHRS